MPKGRSSVPLPWATSAFLCSERLIPPALNTPLPGPGTPSTNSTDWSCLPLYLQPTSRSLSSCALAQAITIDLDTSRTDNPVPLKRGPSTSGADSASTAGVLPISLLGIHQTTSCAAKRVLTSEPP